MLVKFCILCILLYAHQSFAQTDSPRFFLGVGGGITENYNTGVFMQSNADGLGTANGSAIGGSFGVNSEYRLNDAGTSSLLCNINYESKPGKTTWNLPPATLTDSSMNQQGSININSYVQSTYDLLNVELLYKGVFPNIAGLGFRIGPKLGFVTNTHYDEYVQLLNPNAVFLPSYSQTLVLADSLIPQAHKFRLGLVFGVQYDIPYGAFIISPVITYDSGITSVSESWYVNSVAATVELKYGL